MTNDEIKNQLRVRRNTIKELMFIQKIPLAADLLKCELNYVECMIEYLERYGCFDGIILTKKAEPPPTGDSRESKTL